MSDERILCRHCGQRLGIHGGSENPYAAPLACPVGEFPKWPTSVRDEQRAGRLFDQRVRKFWTRSRTTFSPRV